MLIHYRRCSLDVMRWNHNEDMAALVAIINKIYEGHPDDPTKSDKLVDEASNRGFDELVEEIETASKNAMDGVGLGVEGKIETGWNKR